MTKSRKNTVMRTLKKTANKTLPAVDKGLKTVGSTAKSVVNASLPIVEKGVSAVYGTMATGLDLGVKGAKSITKGMTKSRRRHRSLARSLAGGRRHRSRRYRRH